MPVLKQLRVDDVTYDTVGEASVTQVVSTGTKIATIAIDGTSTDLYAPSGSAPTPMTAQEIADAVEIGWPAPLPYNITDSFSMCRSITTDGTYGASVTTKETEAMAGDLITIATPAMEPTITGQNVGVVAHTYVDSFLVQDDPPIPPQPFTAYSFVMPEDDVEITT